MNQFIEALLNTQPATWIAMASLSVSIAALTRKGSDFVISLFSLRPSTRPFSNNSMIKAPAGELFVSTP